MRGAPQIARARPRDQARAVRADATKFVAHRMMPLRYFWEIAVGVARSPGSDETEGDPAQWRPFREVMYILRLT
ncbi:hypothetical protein D1O30_02755 [Methylocystis hirsuta]|uniref:Uncharacterized protein n=1 Tax=Methylocystis hirsuta TaxID=369798 RepID=A0A3M9XLY4_9HYPH|nr:hypothetical protein D1O30_02755 [Methylocystis hirsuta]